MDSQILEQVRGFYNKFPYPNYPLLATPQWQQGYLAHSRFAASLTLSQQIDFRSPQNILVAGCGEVLPYFFSIWEPKTTSINYVDISDTSLSRARFRIYFHHLLRLNPQKLRQQVFIQDDLDDFLSDKNSEYSHIDSYGVIHHMKNPLQTFGQLALALRPGGTMRLMVYNTAARQWITSLQKAFETLKISPYVKSDVHLAKYIVLFLRKHHPYFQQRISHDVSESALKNTTRFVDTFLHPREARVTLSQWFKAIENSGLKIIGLMDRYAELDDLPNPLWQSPSETQLSERASDFRFENNLELYLTKPDKDRSRQLSQIAHKSTVSQKLSPPPQLWFSFRETGELSMFQRRSLWRDHLNYVFHGLVPDPILYSQLSHATIKRLARLGAILPGMLPKTGGVQEMSMEPLSSSMSPPYEDCHLKEKDSHFLLGRLRQILVERNLYQKKRLHILCKRLQIK